VPDVVVLIKYTPELTVEHRFTADRTVDRAAVPGRSSELDEYAAEQALRLVDASPGWRLTRLTRGPADAAQALRGCVGVVAALPCARSWRKSAEVNVTYLVDPVSRY
jgi:electron transfer flavoprotein alpha/beta subunit